MTQATTRSFAAYQLLLESPTTTGTFVAPCGLTERSVQFTKDLSDTNVPDCDNEDAASWTQRDVVSKSVRISGQGVMALESEPRWRAAYESDQPVNVRINKTGNKAAGGGYWLGQFHLSSFEDGATKGNKVTKTIEMQSTGPVVWTDAAA
ncbi:phage tail tube protein [Methylobacterium tarhaniae]|uniref:phage tail tube protein n=1 Tax=Methylobacterium tarhaniae TaxID=1187852 RepID=UPI003D091BA9